MGPGANCDSRPFVQTHFQLTYAKMLYDDSCILLCYCSLFLPLQEYGTDVVEAGSEVSRTGDEYLQHMKLTRLSPLGPGS